MRKIGLLVSLLLSVTSSLALALPAELGSTRTPLPPKGFGETGGEPGVNVGGDTYASATVIPALPYTDGGSTCGFANDITPPCFVTPAAPDVVYKFTPTVDMCVNISLCGSGYDTGLLVRNGTTNTDVGCNDDACGLSSELEGVNLVAGNEYFIVVDGYNTACGPYTLNVSECPPPPVCDPCPPGAYLEGEPVCADGYIDTVNGGCNSSPVVVTSLLCDPNATICGTYGTFNANGSRDTDWYEFTVNAPTVINVSVNGGGLTGSAVAIIDNLCAPNVLCGAFTPTALCATNTCVAAVGPGTYRVFVASFFDGTPCGTPYVLNIRGMTCPPTAVPTSSWGKLKTLYR